MELAIWFGMILPWILLGICCWLGYQLLRQSGRILLRLEAIEKKLDEPKAKPAPAPPSPNDLPIGSAAPDFELADLHGEKKSLAQFRGRKTLLFFFSPNCGYCTKMLPGLADLAAETAPGRPHLLIVTNGDLAKNQEMFRALESKFTILVQNVLDSAAPYKIQGTPIGYLIDEAGKIAGPRLVGSDALFEVAKTDFPALNGAAHGGKENKGLAYSHLKRDGLTAGALAPNFTLPTLSGGEITLEQHRGRRVLLVFSDPHCGPCDQVAPRLQDLHRRQSDLQILMISRGELDENRAKAKSLGLTFPIAVQKAWEVSRSYAMFATPIAYLIDEQGVIAKDVAIGVEAIVELATDAPQLAGNRR